jgi:F-type H+-transporting ATPase subunit a
MAFEAQAPYAIRQFEVETWFTLKIFGLDVSFTNVSSAMLTTVVILAAVLWLALRRATIVPNRLQAGVEIVYDFVARTVTDTAGPQAKDHVPFVFSIFIFILFGTLLGLTPMKETFTTHLIITGALALIVFVYIIEAGLRRNGMLFFRQFLPEGTPWWLAPLIVLIELVCGCLPTCSPGTC